MTVRVSVLSIDQLKRVEIGAELALETLTLEPFAASSGGR